MALALDKLALPLGPLPRYIVATKDSVPLAAYEADGFPLRVALFKPFEVGQAFYILPDGKIRLPNGKYLAPADYESEIQVVDDEDKAYHWVIKETPSGCTIHHANGNLWTFKYVEGKDLRPVEVRAQNLTQELQVFTMPVALPLPPRNTTASAGVAIQAVPADKFVITGAQSAPAIQNLGSPATTGLSRITGSSPSPGPPRATGFLPGGGPGLPPAPGPVRASGLPPPPGPSPSTGFTPATGLSLGPGPRPASGSPPAPGPSPLSGLSLVPGPLPSPSSAPARLDVDAFVNDERFLSLYIQAVSRIQEEPEDQLLSFYQVAGLHGVPLVEWNQAPGGGSYCRHASPLFPTWHRPYVALFEQLVQKHAFQIAEEYTTDKEEWIRAALDLRQPYWDWAKPGGAIPPNMLLSQAVVRINTPWGIRDVENPLLSYRFKSGQSTVAFPAEFVLPMRTHRHPFSDDPIEAIRKQAANAQEKITMNTHDLFSITTWDAFSNKSETADGATNSLEALHDTLHVLIGRNGHFASACGAFDPLFFFHHAQVDRLLALWDVINDQWVASEQENEQLSPFWCDKDAYWTSKQIRNHEVFNYTYPELQNVTGDLREHVRKRVDSLYGAQSRAVFGDVLNGKRQSITSWSVRFRIKPFTIDRSYSIVVFLGNAPKDPRTWLDSPDLVGSYDVFVAYQPEECENCKSHEDVPIEGFVHLTSTLRKRLPKLSDTEIASYLREHLSLGLIKVDNTIVDLHSIEFKAEVVSRNIARARTRKGPFGAPNAPGAPGAPGAPAANDENVVPGQPQYHPFDIKPSNIF